MAPMLWRLRSFPDFVEPCLPSQVERPPAGRDWVHEIKHDGFRLLARRGEFCRMGVRWLLRQSQEHMMEAYVNLYGNYAIKLFRLQNEMIQTFDRYRRGSNQTVEVRHVHIHPGGQGVVGIVNPPGDREGGGEN